MNVLIAHRFRLAGEAWAALLSTWPEVASTRLVDTTAEAEREALHGSHDVCFVELAETPPTAASPIAEPDALDALEWIRRLAKPETEPAQPRANVLVVSGHGEPRHVAQAMRAGARGYVLQSSTSPELRRALQHVARGETYLGPTIDRDVVRRTLDRANLERGNPDQDALDRAPASEPPRHARLSPREQQTLQMLTNGQSVKEIAYELELSDKTVHAFRASLMDKLEITSIPELTKYAIRHGITTLD